MLVRLLDAFVWRNHGACAPHLSQPLDVDESILAIDLPEDQLGFSYVQGMNVLAAPFLYTMPSEIEAFFCFSKFIEEACPLYVQPTLEGVHRGLKVTQASFERGIHAESCPSSFWIVASNLSTRSCTLICVPRIYRLRFTHLLVCRLSGLMLENIANRILAVLTLCACTPPLDQVLQLWDFLLAFGVHLNVLCVIAQLLLIRDEVMSSSRYDGCFVLVPPGLNGVRSPMRLLRTFPPLEALPVIGIAVTLVRDLPADLYDELVRHPFENLNAQ